MIQIVTDYIAKKKGKFECWWCKDFKTLPTACGVTKDKKIIWKQKPCFVCGLSSAVEIK